jgi:ABC-type amino acid transport substrate-binding protein
MLCPVTSKGFAMKALVGLLALLIAVLRSAPVGAVEIAVFSGDGSPPKMYLQNGSNRGILVDILEYADQRLPNDRMRLTLYPWARAYQQALVGRGGVIGLSWTPRRDDLFDYSAPVFMDEVVLVVRKDRVFPYKTLADLKGKRVGMVRGASFGEAFDRAVADGVFLVDGDNGVQNRLNKLMLGRIDCALFNVGKAGFEEALRVNKLYAALKDDLVVLPVPMRKDPNFLAFPKDMHMKAWLAEFDQVIKNGYDRGEIQKIIVRDLGP